MSSPASDPDLLFDDTGNPVLIPPDVLGRPRSPSAVGPRGPRSLVECCRGMMMRVAPRYADIGDLQFAQHELFFRTRPIEQLVELEENSPQIRADTDQLWADFLYKQDPKAHAHNLKKTESDRKSWRKLYHRSVRKTHEREQAEWEALKARVDEDERIKRANGLKVTDRVVPERRRRGGGRMRAVGPYSTHQPRTSSLIDKARRATAAVREVRHAVARPAPVAPVNPFRGSALVEPAIAAGRPTPKPTMLPPLPTNRMPMSDNDTGPGYSVMPVAPRGSEDTRSPATAKPPQPKRPPSTSAITDVSFFGGAVNEPARDNRSPKTVVRSATNELARKELAAHNAKRARPAVEVVEVERYVPKPAPPAQPASAPQAVAAPPVKPPPPREGEAASPNPKAAVPLSSLFMPKKKRR